MRILALDLGRFNRQTHAVWLDVSSGEMKRHQFSTTVAGLTEAVRLFPSDHVVFEIQPGAGPASDVLRDLGQPFTAANTNTDSFRWKNQRTKTDPRDALKLGKLQAVGDLHGVHVPLPSVRAHAGLQSERAALVEERTRLKNRIHALLERHWISSPAGESLWSTTGLAYLTTLAATELTTRPLLSGQITRSLRHFKELQQHITEVTDTLDALALSRPDIARVQTIPGIGPRTAEAFVVAIDQPQRFRTAKTLSAYLGLVPRVFQSGDTIRHGRITRAGNHHLRGLLVQAAWVAVKIDPYWQAIFERLHRGSKVRRRSAIVAVARRLGVLAWALMRHGTTYKQPASPITSNSEKV